MIIAGHIEELILKMRRFVEERKEKTINACETVKQVVKMLDEEGF